MYIILICQRFKLSYLQYHYHITLPGIIFLYFQTFSSLFENLSPRPKHTYPFQSPLAKPFLSLCLLLLSLHTFHSLTFGELIQLESQSQSCKMADVWNCCQCKSPNLIANADKQCPICPHRRCSSCVTGRPGLYGYSKFPDTNSYSTAPRFVLLSSNFPTYDISHSPSAHSYGKNYTYSTYPSPVYSPKINTVPRHDMAGWWTCCRCQNTINPALALTHCPIDSHVRCGSCYTHRQ